MEKIENQFADQIKIVGARIIVIIVVLEVMVLLALVSFWTSSMLREEAIRGSVIIIGIGLVGGVFLWRIRSAESRNQKKNKP